MVAGEHLPRIGFVEPGMRICTNSVCWDDTCSLFSDVNGDSKKMYDKVKAHLAKIRDLTSGRFSIDDTGATDYALAPIYAILMDDADYKKGDCPNKGKLVIGGDTSKAIGNIYAIVTEAYHNADTTLAFKLMFIDKPAHNGVQNNLGV